MCHLVFLSARLLLILWGDRFVVYSYVIARPLLFHLYHSRECDEAPRSSPLDPMHLPRSYRRRCRRVFRLAPGSWSSMLAPFCIIDSSPMLTKPCLSSGSSPGKVLSVSQEGDACIDFANIGVLQWVFPPNFSNLIITSNASKARWGLR